MDKVRRTFARPPERKYIAQCPVTGEVLESSDVVALLQKIAESFVNSPHSWMVRTHA